MARFFKYIFRILLIAYAALILALVIPPLIGFTTATVQKGTEGNQEVGTVDYAQRIPLEELSAGDRILVTGADSVNVYTVQSVDTENSTVGVASSDVQQITVRSYVYKLVAAVPLIGYIVILLQSVEGVLVLAAAAVVLVILCIATGAWSRKAKEKKLAKKAAKEKEKQEEEAARSKGDSAAGQPVLNERAEAYFAARRAEQERQNRKQEEAFEEYEDFPAKPAAQPEIKAAAPAAAESAADYFDDDFDDDETDAWLHDDVDEEDLFAGLNSSSATDSMMATARLFAINRAAQLKEQMAGEDPDKTRVVAPEELAAVIAKTETAPGSEKQDAAPEEGESRKKAAPVKEIAVDKVINLKELQSLDEDTQKIVLTINIKVVPE